MKSKLLMTLTASAMILGGVAQGAITVTVKDFTSASAGNPIVNSLGVPVALNSVFAQAGIFTTLPNFATDSAATIISDFSAIVPNTISNTSFTGVFTGNVTSSLGAYPTNFSGAAAYMLVGNNSTIANSTAIAVYSLPGQVFTPTVGGVANVSINGTVAGNWLYGIQVPVSTQTTVPSSAYTTGIELTSISVPEPSTALLGALGVLGLLRRRRI